VSRAKAISQAGGYQLVIMARALRYCRSLTPASRCKAQSLYRSLAEVTSETHPRTAGLLASSTRKAAQKVIEEAGEVALEAVRHRTRNVVRESADLLYHLVALWHRAGIDPTDVWIEMRRRADLLGIAEKPPKARREDRHRPIHDIERPPEGNGP
jgi:phosphoribosyl-ATP pyrophosphohydrolase